MPERLSWPQRVALMICAMPELVKSFAWDAFVLFFYAQVVGLNGLLLGLAIAIVAAGGAMAWLAGTFRLRDDKG